MKTCILSGSIVSTTLWELLNIPLVWRHAVTLRNIDNETDGDVYKNKKEWIRRLRMARKLQEKREQQK